MGQKSANLLDRYHILRLLSACGVHIYLPLCDDLTESEESLSAGFYKAWLALAVTVQTSDA